MRIIDDDGNQARGTVVFLVARGKVAVSEILYSYDKIFDDKFFNMDGYSGRPKLIRSGSYYNDGYGVDLSDYDNYVDNNDLQYQQDQVDQLSSISGTDSAI